MTLQDWGAVGELVSAAAVVATLIYLSVQIRQSTVLAKAQHAHDALSAFCGFRRHIIEHPDILAKLQANKELSVEEAITRNYIALDGLFVVAVAYENAQAVANARRNPLVNTGVDIIRTFKLSHELAWESLDRAGYGSFATILKSALEVR